MKKDWTGNSKTTFTTLGASSHTREKREENDYYATHPEAVRMLFKLEDFNSVLEPSCGEGHLAKEIKKIKGDVTASDLIDRGYGTKKNFLQYNKWDGDIITNPPYKYAKEFILHALKIIPDGNKVAMFLKLQFLEGQNRKGLFLNHPFRTLYVSSSRILCAKNGEFTKNGKKISSAVAYGWYVWHKGFHGNPIIKWFN